MNEIHDWRLEAVCATVDPEIFFPHERIRLDGDADPYKEARAVCAVCPVKAECLADVESWESWAVSSRHGMFGGLTPDERMTLRRQTKRKRLQREKSRHSGVA